MKQKLIIVLTICLLGLTACGARNTPTALPTLDATVLNQTAIYQVTLAATLAYTPIPTQTLPPLSTWTPIPTIDRTRPPIQTPTPDIPCDMAAAGHPIDVTIPDGMMMEPGESFSKTWRLENVGSCTWTRLYALTFFSGNSMNAIQVNPLLQPIQPGGVIDVTVNMEAPLDPGIYQSNWMLSNEVGELFGIGPNGDAPFWVKIEVVPSVTATPQLTPTPTSTPVVYKTGDAVVQNSNQFDLDSGTINPDDVTETDFVYQKGSDPAHILMTMNGTRWVVYGNQEPTYGACVQSQLSGNAISFTEITEEIYVCYRTSDALPGWLKIKAIEGEGLSISFLTWSKP